MQKELTNYNVISGSGDGDNYLSMEIYLGYNIQWNCLSYFNPLLDETYIANELFYCFFIYSIPCSSFVDTVWTSLYTYLYKLVLSFGVYELQEIHARL